MPKMIFEVPIMQAMYSKIKIVAYSEQEAVDMTNICTKHKINESDFMRKAIVGYPFDFTSPQNQIDTTEDIKVLGTVGGIDEKDKQLLDEESIAKVAWDY